MNSILNILLNASDYISGEEISRQLGVSRTVVWKQMNRLRAQGYKIESITNKGYRLKDNFDGFATEEISFLLKDHPLVSRVFVYDTIDSTNLEGKRLADTGVSPPFLVLSEEQTQGRGRRGRDWFSMKGQGIYMSLVIKPDFKPTSASMLTLLAGLSVMRAIHGVTGLEAAIKWPNDIVIEGKKVCGILTEMSAEIDYIHYVVIGIGINVNQDSFSEEISAVAASLKQLSGQSYERKALIKEVLDEFKSLFEPFLITESLGFVLEEYNKGCINLHKRVRLIDPKGITEGIAEAITSDGALLLRMDDGCQLLVQSGEVSVRGMYDYVD